MMNIFKGFAVFCSAVTVLVSVVNASIYCKNDDNKDVNWFFIYKLPNGGRYLYVDSNTPSEPYWTESSKRINESSGALPNTIALLRAAERDREQRTVESKDLTYAVYNNELEGKPDKGGHTKGLFMFDKEKGVWLIHSFTKFPERLSEPEYFFPKNGLMMGQIALCVTFPSTELETIAKHLLLQHPNIYASAAASHWKDHHFLNLLLKGEFPKQAPFTRTANLTDEAGNIYISFAKHKHFENDVYSGLVAASLQCSLLVSTWLNGNVIPLKPYCVRPYTVEEVTDLAFQLRGGNSVDVKNSVDHSKWATCNDKTNDYVCVGTLNRVESQKKRGGETLCFKNALLNKLLLDTVDVSVMCPSRKRGRE